MKKGKITSVAFWIVVVVLPIVGIIAGSLDEKTFSSTQQILRDKIALAGFFGPLLFVLIQALQVVIAPISHYAIGLIGGFLYGPWFGGLLNWMGRIIGHVTAFFLSRTIGRPIADRFVSAETLKKYDKYTSDKSLVLFLIYFLPLFPDDEISYLAGLSKMKFRMFLLANMFGHVGGSLGLAYIGSGIDTREPLFWFLFLSTLVGFSLVFYFLRKSEKTH